MMALGDLNEESSQNVEEEMKFAIRNQFKTPLIVNRHTDSACNSGIKECPSESRLRNMSTNEENSMLEMKEEDIIQLDLTSRQLSNRQIRSQEFVLYSPNTVKYYSATNPSMERTVKRHVAEKARSNDIKENELDLKKEQLQLKEKELGLNQERFEKESVRTRQADFIGACTDCLIVGFLIMLITLAYGAYVYSHKRIHQAATTCSLTVENDSWWIRRQIAFVNSLFNILICWVQVASPIIFGVVVMPAIVLVLLILSLTLGHGMAASCMLFSLGVLSGFAGKPCVDALGGKGERWLLYWTGLWLVHLISRLFTPYLLVILYGPERRSKQTMFPYWIRRIAFFGILLSLPILCGLGPFARFSEWISHFSALLRGGSLGLIQGDAKDPLK